MNDLVDSPRLLTGCVLFSPIDDTHQYRSYLVKWDVSYSKKLVSDIVRRLSVNYPEMTHLTHKDIVLKTIVLFCEQLIYNSLSKEGLPKPRMVAAYALLGFDAMNGYVRMTKDAPKDYRYLKPHLISGGEEVWEVGQFVPTQCH